VTNERELLAPLEGAVVTAGFTGDAGDVAAQAELLFDRARSAFAAVGMDLEDVIHTRMYLTAEGDDLLPVRGRRFARPLPTSLGIGVRRLALIDRAAEISFVLAPPTEARERVPADSDFGRMAGYSSAVRAGQRIIVTGSTAGDSAPPGAAEQAEIVLQRGLAMIEHLGGTIADIVQTRIYLTNTADAGAVAAVHAASLGGAAPAMLMIGVVEFGPPELVVKVEFEAIVGSSRRRSALAPDDDLLRAAGASAAVRVDDEVWVSGTSTDTAAGDLDAETSVLTDVIVRRVEALGGRASDLVMVSAYLRDLALAEAAGFTVETLPGVLPPMMVEADPVLDSARATFEARAFIRGDVGVST
jgi:enamine deaminase RidA (YjgF/YER057c/UK114 family)